MIYRSAALGLALLTGCASVTTSRTSSDSLPAAYQGCYLGAIGMDDSRGSVAEYELVLGANSIRTRIAGGNTTADSIRRVRVESPQIMRELAAEHKPSESLRALLNNSTGIWINGELYAFVKEPKQGQPGLELVAFSSDDRPALFTPQQLRSQTNVTFDAQLMLKFGTNYTRFANGRCAP